MLGQVMVSFAVFKVIEMKIKLHYRFRNHMRRVAK